MVEHDRQVLQKGEACQFQEEMPVDGKMHSFLTNKFPLRDNEGNIFGIGIIATDITELRKAQETLTQQGDILQAMFDETSLGIAIMGLDGKTYKVNSAYERITGYTEEEIKSKGLALFTCARDIKDEASQIRSVASKLSDNYTLDRRVICKDGSVKWVRLNGRALSFQEGTQILTTIEDITQQKIMERRLEKYSATLEDLLQQRTTQLLNAKRENIVSKAAGLVGQQLLLKYIFQKESQNLMHDS